MPTFRTEATLMLPEPPPSVNRATANVTMADGRSRQIATAEYKAWTHYAVLKLNSQRGLIGKFYWRADIFFPGKATKADLDNLQKGTFDAMRKADKTPDDRYLVDLRVRVVGATRSIGCAARRGCTGMGADPWGICEAHQGT